MALAALALRADGPVRLEGAGSVSKSWPSFLADLERLRRRDP
jgi:5-enolpyruvylshikimate-3-phosphate synthase